MRTIITVAFLAVLPPLAATDYFVAKTGDDGNDGKSGDKAFLSIQKGVDALAAGDMLIIGPGEYQEVVAPEDLGSEEADTIIRAKIPGTVTLRGDVAAPSFRKVDGYRFVYEGDFDREATAVNEVDTLSILQSVPNVREVEFKPGSFHQDLEAGKIYISSSDLRPPDRHQYTICVLKGRGGICLRRPRRVTVEGLAATGYNSKVRLPRIKGGDGASDNIPWGIFLQNAKRCEIRGCAAYLNSGGIAVQSGPTGGNNVIADCVAYGNWSTHSGEGGNILVFRTNHDVIRDCYAYVGGQNGIRIYLPGGPDPAGLIKNCLGWGHHRFDFHVKAQPLAKAENCVALDRGGVTNHKLSDSLVIGGPGGGPQPERNNILALSQERSINLDEEFADPENLDFRLQPDSRFRGAGPDGRDRGPFQYEPTIYYVKPNGDDKADGLSMKTAWKTLERGVKELRPNDTLCLSGGVYSGDLTIRVGANDGDEIRLRGRGTAPVVINGALTVDNPRAIRFERLNFNGGVSVKNGGDVQFRNCRFVGGDVALRVDGVDDLRVTHCEFTGFKDAAITLRDCERVFLRGDIFDNAKGPALVLDRAGTALYSDYNAYAKNSPAWRVDGSDLALNGLDGHEIHSVVRIPVFSVKDGFAILENKDDFKVGGPLGTALGVYLERRRHKVNELRVVGPFIHSVSDTTANIEWWSSKRAIFDVRWGETPECANRSYLRAAKAYGLGSPLQAFNSFSLSGLKPGATYHFRIAAVRKHALTPSDDHGEQPTINDECLKPLTFTTAKEPEPPRNYYVTPDGSDANTGLNREHAWRTINHAAASVSPGDTVLIAEGVYQEHVQTRTTGDEGRPITFTCVPGEKAWLDGGSRQLVVAFDIANKNFMRLDGLRFRNFQRRDMQGMIRVSRCRDIQITRCFQDGRGGGYDPEFLTAGAVDGLLVKNCVTINPWDGMGWGCGLDKEKSLNIRIENNVILRPLIAAICSSGGENISIVNNIITDNLLAKRKTSLLAGGPAGGVFKFANNCFFLRFPVSERPVTGVHHRDRFAKWEEMSVDKRPNLIANPEFACMRTEGGEGSKSQYFSDGVLGKIKDFPDLFATNPELVERGVGLQPEAFKDFLKTTDKGGNASDKGKARKHD